MSIQLVTIPTCNCFDTFKGHFEIHSTEYEAAVAFQKLIFEKVYWSVHFNHLHVVNVFIDGKSVRPIG